MADLDVIAVITAKPGSEEVVGAARRDLVGPTRDEPGCLAYELYESAATPGTFITVERWRGQDDLDAHMQSDHIAATFAAAGDALAEAPGIHPLKPTGA